MNKEKVITDCDFFQSKKILGIEEINSGLVHEVFRIFTDTGIYISKRRLNSYKKITSKKSKPGDIKFEIEALIKVGHLSPKVPELLFQNKNKGLIIMNDIANGKEILKEFYKSKSKVSTLVITKIFELIDKIQQIDCSSFRKEYYYYIMKDRFIESGIPENLVSDIFLGGKQVLVHGGLSSKNIIINESDVAFCDFETLCIGNEYFDLCYFIAHIVLHEIDNIDIEKIDIINEHIMKNSLHEHKVRMGVAIVVYYRINHNHYSYIPHNIKEDTIIYLNKILKKTIFSHVSGKYFYDFILSKTYHENTYRKRA